MEYIVSADEMKAYDQNTIHTFGISSLVLMERAALKVYEIIRNQFQNNKNILIAVGCGNNGADGMALGRILRQNGYLIDFYIPGENFTKIENFTNSENFTKSEKGKFSEAAMSQYHTCIRYGMNFFEQIPEKQYDLVVDSLFGIGLNREITGEWKEAIIQLNAMNATKISIDIPSGIHSDTGEILGEAFHADETITFGFKKRGQIFYPGAEYCGELICVDIGIDQDSFLGKLPESFTYGLVDKNKLPVRKKAGNKGNFGKVFMFAGSMGMAGASILAGRSIYRTGAGLLRIMTLHDNRDIMQTALPEGVLHLFEPYRVNYDELSEHIKWATCVLAGPGIGTKDYAGKILEFILEKSTCPLIIDADAINLIAESDVLKDLLKKKTKQGQSVTMTPHMGEFARISGKSIESLKHNIVDEAVAFAKEYLVTIVCKDARTVVASAHNNKGIYINTTGNDGMATAGSGDVLAGMITGLNAQGLSAFEAACLGVFLHGTAGDLAAMASNRYSVMASDMIEQLKFLLKEIENEAL